MNIRNETVWNGMIFSKDRALQLQALLDSFFLHCRQLRQVQLHVLYKATSPRHCRQYDKLRERFPQVRFVQEADFRRQTLMVLQQSPIILFLVDDAVFTRPFSPAEITAALATRPDVLGVSLRLGENIRHSYVRNRPIALPPFERAGADLLQFNWTGAGDEFRYALEVSSSVYRSADLLPVLHTLQWSNPNHLEGMLAASRNCFVQARPMLLCARESVAFCNPVNLVQTVCENRSGQEDCYTAESLARLFDEGKRIDVSRFVGFTPRACHQEVELTFFEADEPLAPAETPQTPAVTVEMVAYNAARWIGRAIESVLAQTWTDFELLIVDDGSTDETPRIIDSYKDQRIRCIRKEHENRWAGTNVALAEARGEYILPVDSDDMIAPDYLEKMMAAARTRPEADYIYPARFVPIDEQDRSGGAVWEYQDFSDNRRLPHFLFDQCHAPIPYPGSLKRTRLLRELGGYEETRNVADFIFLCRHALQIRFHRLEDCGRYFYRIHTSNLSRDYHSRDQVMARTLNDMVGLYPPQALCPSLPAGSQEDVRRSFLAYLVKTFEKHASGYHLVKHGEYYQQYADAYRSQLSESTPVGQSMPSAAACPPAFSVHLLVRSAGDAWKRTLESLLRSTGPAMEILLLDLENRLSPSDVPPAARRCTNILAAGEEDPAALRNRALARSSADWILLLREGDQLSADYLSTAAEAIRRHPDVDWFHPAADDQRQVEGPTILRFLFEKGELPLSISGSIVRSRTVQDLGAFTPASGLEDTLFLARYGTRIRFQALAATPVHAARPHVPPDCHEAMAGLLNEAIGRHPPDVICPDLDPSDDLPTLRRKYFEHLMMAFYRLSQIHRGRGGQVYLRYGDHYRSMFLEQLAGNADTTPWTLSGSDRASAMVSSGIESLEQNRPGDALVYFQEARKINQALASLSYAEAVALLGIGRLDQARLACRLELENDPGHEAAGELLRRLQSPDCM